MFVFPMFGLTHQTALAQISIDLSDHERLVFGAGEFDIKRYSGKMQEVSYFVNDRLVFTADQLEIHTAAPPDKNQFHIETLFIRNGQIIPEEVRFAEFHLTDVDVAKLKAFHEANTNAGGRDAIVGDGLTDRSHAQILGLEFVEDGQRITIANIETLGFTFAFLPNGHRYFKNAGLVIDGVALSLTNPDDEFEDLVTVLRARGMQEVVLDMALSQNVEPMEKGARLEFTSNLVMRDLGEMEIIASLDFSAAAFSKMGQMNTDRATEFGVIDSMLEEVALAGLTTTYIDHGLRDVLVFLAAREADVAPSEMRSQIGLLVKNQMNSVLPQNGRRLSQPIEALIDQGGGLELTLAPLNPVKLQNFLGFLLMPDMALDQLGVQLQHLRKGAG